MLQEITNYLLIYILTDIIASASSAKQEIFGKDKRCDKEQSIEF